MTDTLDQQLASRFGRLARAVDEPDWAEVEARADAIARRTATVHRRKPQRSLRKLALAGAVVVVATLIAGPAFGVPQRVADLLFSSAEPAPARTELAFSTLDRGAPAGLETGVIPRSTRKAFEVALPQGARAILWVAPTAKGGHCRMVQLVDGDGRSRGGSGPGCDDRLNATGVGLTVPGPVTQRGVERGPVVVEGHATTRAATAAIVRFEDSAEVDIALTWISEPIDAGFFVYGVPPANWEPGRLPTELRFVDAEGNRVGQQHRIALERILMLPRR
ncbi:MAG TPA: hypothetical protein VFY02_01960, partial [Gaiellaceae bacterium]|nr:hypothetical protein [Gaiellaceae bacterium]